MMFRSILARDMMTTNIVTVSPDMDVHEAMDVLLANEMSGAPVVDAEGLVVGIFSEKDCLPVLVDGVYENVPSQRVEALMTAPARTISPEMDFLTVAHVFMKEHYRRLPVVEDGRLVGQLSRRDLLRAATSMLSPEKANNPSFLYLSRVLDRKDAPVS